MYQVIRHLTNERFPAVSVNIQTRNNDRLEWRYQYADTIVRENVLNNTRMGSIDKLKVPLNSVQCRIAHRAATNMIYRRQKYISAILPFLFILSVFCGANEWFFPINEWQRPVSDKNILITDELFDRIKILCFVLTTENGVIKTVGFCLNKKNEYSWTGILIIFGRVNLVMLPAYSERFSSIFGQ